MDGRTSLQLSLVRKVVLVEFLVGRLLLLVMDGVCARCVGLSAQFSSLFKFLHPFDVFLRRLGEKEEEEEEEGRHVLPAPEGMLADCVGVVGVGDAA